MIQIEELWRDLQGLSHYKVSNKGKIYSKKHKKILKLRTDKDGYKRISLIQDNGIRILLGVHKLVLLGFEGENKDKPIPHHKNNIKDDNRLENLEWVTISENTKNAYADGLLENPQKIRCILYYKEKPIAYYDSIVQLSKSLKVNRNYISANKDNLANTFKVSYTEYKDIDIKIPYNLEIFKTKIIKTVNKPFKIFNNAETLYFYTCREMENYFDLTNSAVQRYRKKGYWKNYTIKNIDVYEYYKAIQKN